MNRISKLGHLVVAVLAALSLIILTHCHEPEPPDTTLIGGPDVTGSREMALDESAIVATIDGQRAIIRLPIRRLTTSDLPVTVEVAIRDLDRALVGEASVMTTLSDSITEQVLSVDGLDAQVSTGDLTSYVIHYQVHSESSLLFGRRSLYDAAQKRSIHLLSSDTFYDGETSHIRIVASDPVTGRPLAGAAVEVYLNGDEDEPETLVFSGQTDEFGTLSAPVEADETLLGSRTLRVVVDSELGTEEIERPVSVSRDQRILITTDKPLYQPGQIIHIRTLTLRRGNLEPEADEPIRIEVLDGRGNKIMGRDLTTDAYGIAATELQLARELNMGEFVIRAFMGDTTSTRSVTVDRYRLPRFAVTLTPDADYYEPGQEAGVLVSADYLFGEPVAGASLSARAFRIDAGGEVMLSETTATLSSSGTAELMLAIPPGFNAQSLQSGSAFVRLDVTVTDGAGEERDASAMLPVASSGIIQVVFPAHDLLPGRSNTFHVLTSNPLGRPLSATCEASLANGTEPTEVTTDERGAGSVTLDAPDTGTFAFSVDCQQDGTRSVQQYAFELGAEPVGAIAVLTDSSLIRAGESISATIRATGSLDRVFLDLIANNRSLSTTSLTVEAGVAETTLDIPLDVTGAVELLAYTVAPTGELIRGQRMVYVEAANDLSLEMTADREEYRPGDPAVVDVHVTDEAGQGVAAAVGLQIVDEAVFALQDMRPGVERLFFQLEQELLTPQYDTHGFDIGEVVNAGESSATEREQAAEILFAASQGSPGYGIVVDTLAEARSRSASIVQSALESDLEAILTVERTQLSQLYDYGQVYENASTIIAHMNGRHFDPWGQAYGFEPVIHYGDNPDSMNVRSAGPDEVMDSDDDVERLVWLDELIYGPGGGGDAMADGEGGPVPGGMGNDFDEPAAPEERGDDQGTGTEGGGSADSPRVRRFFPETLLVEPALITDPDGRASLGVDLADSITTWRVTGMANSRSGQLGSGTSAIRVFQPFFVDVDMPVTLTQNDEVEVPVALFNFADAPQTVELTVDTPGTPWYELLSSSQATVELSPGEVTSVPVRVRVADVGVHTFQVTAVGSELSDAVQRSVEVLPDGAEQVVSVSDRLDGNVSVNMTFPVTSIDGADVLLVKIYPGLFSQVVEGLDSMLRMPSGCFEQTSSSTYPNVLVLDYLRRTNQASPEVEALALEYIATGYQRLLSYEVSSGGFEWFGNAPAHRILTAYGLLEFSDMSEVFEVDPAVIARTQDWLVSQQEPDGSFTAAPEGIHEGATNNFTDSDLRATAYIAYALLESGYTGAATDAAVSWVKQRLGDIDDNYTLALVANMLLSHDVSDPAARSLIDQLEAQKETGDGTVFWSSESQSFTYGSGSGMTMETTALALYAYIRGAAYPETIEGGVSYLVQNKDSFGSWSSTQATILSLRTFLALLENTSEPADAAVDVFLNGEIVQHYDIDSSNSDLLRQIDLRELIVKGDNLVEIEMSGEGSFLYQVVGRYYLPWSEVPEVPSPIDITVEYPTGTGVGTPTPVGVDVTNHLTERAEMVMVQVGVPPGFDVDMRTLENHVASGLFSRADRTADGVDLYLYGLEPDEATEFTFDVVARFPMSVQTPTSAAYLYYEPDVRGETEPVTVTVE